MPAIIQADGTQLWYQPGDHDLSVITDTDDT